MLPFVERSECERREDRHMITSIETYLSLCNQRGSCHHGVFDSHVANLLVRDAFWRLGEANPNGAPYLRAYSPPPQLLAPTQDALTVAPPSPLHEQMRALSGRPSRPESCPTVSLSLSAVKMFGITLRLEIFRMLEASGLSAGETIICGLSRSLQSS